MDSSLNESNESSAMQSSHEGTGSYSHVTSVQRSESVKRSRQIEDADPNSRSSGTQGSPKATNARSSSSQRSDRRSIVKKPDKTRGSGGSPSERARRTTADEDLEKMIAEMQDQGDQMREQMMQIEDERKAELALDDSRMQSARPKSGRT